MTRYGQHYRRAPAAIGFNATPMIDVIFMLTVFFMLVSTFSEQENRPVDLPKPTASQAKSTKTPQRVVINCWPAAPEAPEPGQVKYSIGPNRPQPLSVISSQLGALKVESPDLKVVVRADRRLCYADVRAVMQIIADHQIKMLHVAAERGEGK